MTGTTSFSDSTVKQVVFEAVLKGTGAINDPAILQELKPFYNLTRPQHLYSPEALQQFLLSLCEKLYPALATEQALFEIGKRSFHGFNKGTIVGKVALAAIHIMGPVRLMKMNGKLWEDVGVGQCRIEQIGEKRFRSHYRNFALLSHGAAGCAAEALNVAGAKNLRYTLEPLPAPGSYRHNFNIVYEWD